jgi:hypothetical protein
VRCAQLSDDVGVTSNNCQMWCHANKHKYMESGADAAIHGTVQTLRPCAYLHDGTNVALADLHHLGVDRTQIVTQCIDPWALSASWVQSHNRDEHLLKHTSRLKGMLSGVLAFSLVCRSARWLNSNRLVSLGLMLHMHTCTHMRNSFPENSACDLAVQQIGNTR